MFASLKSKIKEETGSDITKLTNSWRNGAFLGKITQRDESVLLLLYVVDNSNITTFLAYLFGYTCYKK